MIRAAKYSEETTSPMQGKPHLLDSLAKRNKLVRSEITSPSSLKCRVQSNSSRFVAP